MILNSSSIWKLNATMTTRHISFILSDVCEPQADIFHNNFLGPENAESSSTERLKSNNSLPKLQTNCNDSSSNFNYSNITPSREHILLIHATFQVNFTKNAFTVWFGQSWLVDILHTKRGPSNTYSLEHQSSCPQAFPKRCIAPIRVPREHVCIDVKSKAKSMAL